jgi:hypothetical protein
MTQKVCVSTALRYSQSRQTVRLILGNLVAKHRKVHLFDIDIPGRQKFKVSLWPVLPMNSYNDKAYAKPRNPMFSHLGSLSPLLPPRLGRSVLESATISYVIYVIGPSLLKPLTPHSQCVRPLLIFSDSPKWP